MWSEIKEKIMSGMNKSLNHFNEEILKIRGNRPSSGMIDSIKFKDTYGNETMIKFVSSISTTDTSINIQPWDLKNIRNIEKAIIEANIGLTPNSSANSVIIQVPKLTTEKINQIIKHVSSMAEEAKISVRNVRRLINDEIKKLEKNSEISEDDSKKFSIELQKVTDEYIKQIDDILNKKEEEIKKV